MAQVTVTIDGKAYRMACEAGQETHLEGLAQGFDRYVGHLKSQFGEIGDLRLTVMAAIMVMDELSDLQRRLARQEEEIAELKSFRDNVQQSAETTDNAVAGMLAALTSEVRSIAAKLSDNDTAH